MPTRSSRVLELGVVIVCMMEGRMSFNDRREGESVKTIRIGSNTDRFGTRQDIETGTNVNN